MKKIFVVCICIVLAVSSTGCSKDSKNKDIKNDITSSITGEVTGDAKDNNTGEVTDNITGNITGEDEKKGYLPMYTDVELDKASEEAQKQSITAKFTDEFEMENLDQWNIKFPQGILCRENDIIIADKKENCLVVKDYEGNTLQTIGKYGKGKVEFIGPAALASENGKIYVVDVGNNRIQVLTDKFEYVDEIFVENYQSSTSTSTLTDDPVSLAVDKNENIYLTRLSFSYSYILCYEKGSKDAKEFGRNFVGTLTASEGIVYATSMASVFTSNGSYGYRTGYSILYQVDAGGMTKLCDLPNGYDPVSILIQDSKIIALSSSYGRLDILSLNGEYQNTIYLTGSMRGAYLSMAGNGDYYISDAFSNKLIRVKRS